MLAVPLAAGVVYAFAKPEVKETVADYSAALQTKNQGKAKSGLVVRDAEQRRDTDNLMLDHISSEKGVCSGIVLQPAEPLPFRAGKSCFKEGAC